MMDIYYWDEKSKYLRQSRAHMWNNDYIEFLIKSVWKITKPVNILDFGCGLGFLGSLIMPLLPQGSTYTGIDKGNKLLDEARSIFKNAPFKVEFLEEDLFTYTTTEKYDISICQTLLMHLPEPQLILKKMCDSIVKGGKVICIEVNWNIENAALFIDGIDIDGFCNLGILQKLWANDYKRNSIDRCIGIKLPVYMQKLGLKDVNVRANDCVKFVNPYGDKEEHSSQLNCFLSDWGADPGDRATFIESLCNRGLSTEEAAYQYECESKLTDFIKQNKEEMSVVHAPTFIITYATK